MPNTIRSVAEKLTRPIRFRRRLPAAFGRAPLWISPSAGLRYLLRPMASIDPVLLQLTDEFVTPGNVAWDVGANVGLFSFAAANKAGREGAVVAMEPDSWLIELLRRSVRAQRSNSAPVRVLPVAVANSVDIRSFCIATRSRATNFLREYGSTQIGSTAEVQSVMAVTLDWLAERMPPPDVLKIDVEGAELEVLEGAAALLRDKPPTIICEVSAERSAQVSELLCGYGYQIFDGEAPRRLREPLSHAPWCTVAVPSTKVAAQ